MKVITSSREFFVDNNRCLGCHGDFMNNVPQPSTILPAVDSTSTTFGKKYDRIYIYGTDFGTNTNKTEVYFTTRTNNVVAVTVNTKRITV